MKKIIIGFTFLTIAAGLYAQTFRFSQNKGDKYRIVSEVSEGVFFNDELLGESTILNRIAVNVAGSDNSGADLSVNYGISEQSLQTGLYIYSLEEEVSFRMENNGLYGSFPPDQYLPSVRNIPTFPDRTVTAGESWSAMAEEVHDLFPFFRIDYRLHIPFRVFYTYEGRDMYQNRSVDVINITYHFLQELDVLTLPPGSLPGGASDLPIAVSGDFKQRYLWDSEAGIPAAVTETFRISYTLSSGNRYIFRGRAEGRVIEADQWEKESVKEMIEEVLQDEKMEDVTVSVSDDGVVLTLENLHFYPDSPELLPEEKGKLADLARIIRGFPAHDLLIRGHTAYVAGRNGLILSEQRASSVAAYFMEKGIKTSSEMVVQGVGSQEPVADNSSEEGRKRNRRVEITILDN